MSDPTEIVTGNPEHVDGSGDADAGTGVRRPSPTSRARRAGAVAVSSAAHRPAPRPHAEPGRPAGTDTLTAEPDDARMGAADHPEPLSSAEVTSESGTPPERRRGGPVLVTAGLLVAVLAAALLNWWLWQSKDNTGSQKQRQQVLSSAKTAVPAILSYNYKSFDKSVAAGRSMLTGRAQTDYVTAMNGSIKPTAVKNTAVVQAQTDAAGIESVSPSGKQVTLVVFGEQKVTNATLTAPRTDLFRVRVTMDRVNGNWLVSKFDQI
jgi:Mce-associated membrane protein